MINNFSIVIGAKYFSSGIFQSYLVFIPSEKCIKHFNGTTRTNSWKSNRISEKNIENIAKIDSNFVPIFADHDFLPAINFDRHYLIKTDCLYSWKRNKSILLL